MSALSDGRVVVVTGAGRGIGREEALEFARNGARVVVNDTGVARDGTGQDASPAQSVVEEILAMGGEAVASHEDVSDWEGARRLVQTAVDTYGRLDTLVNNAGILRDRMLVNMSPQEWDDVMRVHLRGTFAPTRHAVDYWRERSKAGEPVTARLVNTSSASGLYGNVGQTNYGAAKAGIAAFTVIAAQELERYGVGVNAIAPGALTRMTEGLMPADSTSTAADIAPLVVWLGSAECTVTGRVFNVRGGHISVAEGWHNGPAVTKDSAWTTEEMSSLIPGIVAAAAPNAGMDGALPGR
ncbi:MAG: short-chain dehydrogenase [Frankiales bacterium]|nr:short-chain dehydrogenase [Frankiales bacterium]